MYQLIVHNQSFGNNVNSLLVSPRHSWTAVLARRASVARNRGHGCPHNCQLVGATDPLPSCNVTHGVLYMTASPVVPHWTGNTCRLWTARSTSDEVRHIDVTNCCSTCAFDNTSPASCCNCRAADRAFSTPM